MKKNIIIISLIAIVLLAVLAIYSYRKDNRGQEDSSPIAQTHYICDGGKTIDAAFYQGEEVKVAPGEMPVPSGSAILKLSDGRNLDLAQTISADGMRYANADESFVFWSKGYSALVLEDGSEKDYTNCIDSRQSSCTEEAKICPDGSSVGRTGQNCEFAPCPGEGNNGNWQTKTDSDTGISFQYPETLMATYIHAVDWPPMIQISDQPYSCAEAGSETDRAGKTEKRMVDNREYCRTSVVEGAAGSIYTQYAYAFPYSGKTAIFTFTTRATQCGNYSEAERQACEAERGAFDMDGIVDRMAQSIAGK